MRLLKQNTKVVAQLFKGYDIVYFNGEVIGHTGRNIAGETTEYIVKCTDGTFPNKLYKYDSFVLPAHLVKRKT